MVPILDALMQKEETTGQQENHLFLVLLRPDRDNTCKQKTGPLYSDNNHQVSL